MGFRVGEGKSVLFLFDDWVGIGPFWSLLPRLFRVVSNKESSVKDCYFWDGSKVSWHVSCRRVLRQPRGIEYESLLSILANAFICRVRKTFVFGSLALWGVSLLDHFIIFIRFPPWL